MCMFMLILYDEKQVIIFICVGIFALVLLSVLLLYTQAIECYVAANVYVNTAPSRLCAIMV